MIRSLRWRLQAWHALVLVAAVSSFGGIVYGLQWRSRLQLVDSELDRASEAIHSRLRRFFPRGPWDRGAGRRTGERNRSGAGGPFRGSREGNPTPPDLPGAGPPDASRSEAGPQVTVPPETGEASSTEGVSSEKENGASPPRSPETRDDNRRERSDDRRERSDERRQPPWVGANRAGGATAQTLDLPDDFESLFSGEDDSRLYFRVWTRDGVAMFASESAPEVDFPALRPSDGGLPERMARGRGEFREVVHTGMSGVNVLVGRSLKEEWAAQRRAAGLLFVAGLSVVAVGLVGGYGLASRAIKPIRVMTKTAEQISAENLAQRIDLKETASELGQLAVVLNGAFDRLQAAFERQNRFTADASHELRTPLSIMLAHSELALSKPCSAEEYQAALEACGRAARRMKSLTEGLLLLARYDAGIPPQRRELTRWDEVVSECLQQLLPLAEKRKIVAEVRLAPVTVRGDRVELGRLAFNLLANAIRYNLPGGSVFVETYLDGDSAVLRVRDTGPGIPPADVAHVFERFYRVDKARSRDDGGSGLGLAICQSIAVAHGGAIDLQSEPGQGTTVSVRLPSRAPDDSPSSRDSHDGERKTFLEVGQKADRAALANENPYDVRLNAAPTASPRKDEESLI